jgi:hypothetical protein
MGTSLQPVWFRVCPRISFTLAHIISCGRLPRSHRSLQIVRISMSSHVPYIRQLNWKFRRFNTHVSALFPQNQNLREQYATNHHALRIARSECFTIWETWSLDMATYPNSLPAMRLPGQLRILSPIATVLSSTIFFFIAVYVSAELLLFLSDRLRHSHMQMKCHCLRLQW